MNLSYPAARTVAPMLEEYFACHQEEASKRAAGPVAPLPDVQSIEAVLDAAFWTSLRREEGYETRISLAILPPEKAQDPMLFERLLPLDPAALTRLAPAVERPGIHLGVWRAQAGAVPAFEEGALSVWGTTRGIPFLCFVVEVAAPGLLVIKHHNGEETRKFINVAVLEGDQVKMVDEHIAERPDSPRLLKSLLQFNSPGSERLALVTLVRLATSMREHRRGGTLLIVPAERDSWRTSILQPMKYAVTPFGQLAAFASGVNCPAIAAIGGLTAVDGATVLNNRYELLGFGAKIVRLLGSPAVEQVVLSEPIRGATSAVIHPDQLGGTRHLSAAQFVHDQRDSVALVASQDGRFTVFEWSPADSIVHAHRIDTLLL